MAQERSGELGLGSLLRQLIAALDGDVQAVYDSLAVPFRPRFFPVVRHLRAHGTALIGELADHAGVSQPAITQTLGEMRDAGLIAVEAAKDRRARRVRLTREGEALSDRLGPVWRAVQRAESTLDDELPQPLREMLATTIEALARNPFYRRIMEGLEDG
jgi:DNA-binding MarR family transcriptional regulator